MCGVALLSFAAGALVTARANSDRVFELRIYHVTPGKVAALETRFRNEASKLLAKHGLDVVGYWVPDHAPASDDTFIYLLASPIVRRRSSIGRRCSPIPHFNRR